MSDFDFGDALEDAIENRQNTAGFIFAHNAQNQRSAQLKALENQLALDNKRVATEGERLSVEKRRLQIEAEKLELDKRAKSSNEAQNKEVRVLRGLMVDIGADLAVIKKAISTMVSGRQDRSITLQVAYVQVLLKHIGGQSHVLSDLGDLKEIQRLTSEFTEVSRESHQKGLSPDSPLQLVVNEIEKLDKWVAGAKTLLDRARWMVSPAILRENRGGSKYVGVPMLKAIRVELMELMQKIDGNVEKLSRQQPLFCFDGESLNSHVFRIWKLLHKNRPSENWSNSLREARQGLGQTRKWVEEAQAQLSQICLLESRALSDKNALRVALQELERGEPKKARILSTRPVDKQFDDPLWDELKISLQKAEKAYARVSGFITKGWDPFNWDPFKMAKAIRSLKENVVWANVDPNSEWGLEINALELKVRRQKIAAAIVSALVLISMACIFFAYTFASQGGEALAVAMKKAGTAYEKFKKENRAGEEKSLEIAPGIEMTFCWCPAGKFTMGSPESEQVEVTLSRGFWMAKTEVTQAQWQAVMEESPSEFTGANRPVEKVSWDDAQEFLTKLNAIVGYSDGLKMVLPTEAQWEYAARAGETGPYSGGTVEEVAWYKDNSGRRTHKVGTKRPNAWGLHDMHGNVREWCADWYEDEQKGGVDPQGAASGSDRVDRGGSCDGIADHCGAANRSWFNPSSRSDIVGFRPARGL